MKKPVVSYSLPKRFRETLKKKRLTYFIRAGKVGIQLFPGAEQMPIKRGVLPLSTLV